MHSEIVNFSEAEEVWQPDYSDFHADHSKGDKDVVPEDAFRIRSIFKYVKFLKQKEYFVNKHPISSVRILYIREIFPDCKFLHIYRDGRAVVASQMNCMEDGRHKNPLHKFIKPKDWRELLTYPHHIQSAYAWKQVLSEIETSFKSLNNDDYYEVSYESFCEKPRSILNEIDKFCGFKHGNRLADKIPERLSYNNSKWLSYFEVNEREDIVKIINSKLKQYGY